MLDIENLRLQEEVGSRQMVAMNNIRPLVPLEK
jgi:hypothetical protein